MNTYKNNVIDKNIVWKCTLFLQDYLSVSKYKPF